MSASCPAPNAAFGSRRRTNQAGGCTGDHLRQQRAVTVPDRFAVVSELMAERRDSGGWLNGRPSRHFATRARRCAAARYRAGLSVHDDRRDARRRGWREAGIDKKKVTAFALAILIYSPHCRSGPRRSTQVRLPGLAANDLVQRRACARRRRRDASSPRSTWLGSIDPRASLGTMVAAYRWRSPFRGRPTTPSCDAISHRERCVPCAQLGVGSGMVQYGWRISLLDPARGRSILFVATLLRLAGGIPVGDTYLLAIAPLAAAGGSSPANRRPPHRRRCRTGPRCIPRGGARAA